MNRRRLLALPLMLAGCAGAPALLRPRFALPPATLGRALALQQQLRVEVQGQPQPPLDALLEVDAHVLRVAVFMAGQRVARLHWDGQALDADWPARLPGSAADMLSDIQLTWWPLEALQRTLLPPWRLSEAGGERTLWQGDAAVARVTQRGAEALLEQLQTGYRLHITSRDLAP